MEPINIKYCISEEQLIKALNLNNRDEIWARHISLDDWDYALVVEGDYTKDTPLERLLDGCCSNDWTYLEDKNLTVGMAYHA